MTLCHSHRKTDPFVRFNKSIVYDSNLSLKAKGLLSIAFSRPDNWSFYKSEMMKHCSDGEHSFDSGIKELENSGYLYRKAKQNKETGKLEGMEWHFFEEPISEEEFKKFIRNGGFPGTGEIPRSDKPGPNKKDYYNKKENSSSNTHAQEEKPKAHTATDPAADFFPCLERNWIDRDFAQEIMRKGLDEKTIQEKVAITEKRNPANKGAYLRKVLENDYKTPQSEEERIESNKLLAKQIVCQISMVPQGVNVELLNKYVEIGNGIHQGVYVEYADQSFEEKFREGLAKWQVKIS